MIINNKNIDINRIHIHDDILDELRFYRLKKELGSHLKNLKARIIYFQLNLLM